MNYNIRHFLSLLAAVALALTPALTHAQGICIPDPVEVRQVKGQVFFAWNGKRRPLERVTVEVLGRSDDENRLVASATTDVDGRFHIANLKPGRYWLVTKHGAVIGIGVEMSVKTASTGRKACGRLIVFTLGADPSKTCGGGNVEIVKP